MYFGRLARFTTGPHMSLIWRAPIPGSYGGTAYEAHMAACHMGVVSGVASGVVSVIDGSFRGEKWLGCIPDRRHFPGRIFENVGGLQQQIARQTMGKSKSLKSALDQLAVGSVGEIAAIFGKSRVTVYEWRRRGCPIAKDHLGKYRLKPIIQWRERTLAEEALKRVAVSSRQSSREVLEDVLDSVREMRQELAGNASGTEER
ncbi:hypothetical protein [Planctomicrobium sp. SH664]|uniref:hypothetical protein n=1 Tax=Planctomicrobium sp. SH664 TaxID=3448125 RepID=UPI003F5C1FFD